MNLRSGRAIPRRAVPQPERGAAALPAEAEPARMDPMGQPIPAVPLQTIRRAPRLEMPKYDGSSDPIRFFQIYEQACVIYGENTSEERLKLFPMSLQGAAQDWFFNQSTEERTTWEAVKAALITRFKPAKFLEDPFLLLSKVKMGRREGVRDYIERVKHLRSECNTVLTPDHAVIMWFLAGLPRSIRRELKRREQYQTLQEAMDDAIREEDEGSDDDSHTGHTVTSNLTPSIASTSDTSVHTTELLLDQMTKSHKQQMEQLTTQFDQKLKTIQGAVATSTKADPPAQQYPRRENVWCPICSQNHTGNECPVLRQRMAQRYCHLCNASSHETLYCPYNPRVVQQRRPPYQTSYPYHQGAPNAAPRMGPAHNQLRMALPAPPGPGNNQVAHVNLTAAEPEVPISEPQEWYGPDEAYMDPAINEIYATYAAQPQCQGGRIYGCYGCGERHRIAECPYKGTYIPFCRECGYGHCYKNCPIRPGTSAPLNLIQIQSQSAPKRQMVKPNSPNVPVLAITRTQKRKEVAPPSLSSTSLHEDQPSKSRPYPNVGEERKQYQKIRHWIQEAQAEETAQAKKQPAEPPLPENPVSSEPAPQRTELNDVLHHHEVPFRMTTPEAPQTEMLTSILSSRVNLSMGEFLRVAPQAKSILAEWLNTEAATSSIPLHCAGYEEANNVLQIGTAWESEQHNITLPI